MHDLPRKLPKLLLLLAAVTCLAAMQAVTPAPTPSEPGREAVIEKIKAHARTDFENGLPPRTSEVVRWYAGAGGLSQPEVAQVYDEEYRREKKARPFAGLRPETGWIVAGIMAVLAVLGMVLRDGIAGLFKYIGRGIYKRFSGTVLLRPWALACYREALKDKYANIRLPFRPNRPLPMKEVYVPLKISSAPGVEGGEEAAAPLPGGNGFRADYSRDEIEVRQALAQYRRLMIKGQPGAGKSMLLKYVVFKYAEGGFVELPDRPIPILLELHRLNDPRATLEGQLVEELKRNNFDHGDTFIGRNLKKGRLMILLDGLDEVSGGERARVVQQVKDFVGQYPQCRVIITCRTAVYRNDFADAVEQTMDIVDFKDSQIRQFLRSWELDKIPDKSVEQLMQTLLQRPPILKMARNPLLLTIIAYLYADTGVKLPHSRAEFYLKATDILLDIWHDKYNTFSAHKKRRVLEQLALANHDSAGQRPQDPLSMDIESVKAEALAALRGELKPEETETLIAEIKDRSSLLLTLDGGRRYQFAHLTLQEYFAATRLRDDPAGLLARFRADPQHWRETVKLWCGLGLDATEFIRQVSEIDPITAFECIADAERLDFDEVAGIIDRFKPKLTQPDREDPVARAFGAVASAEPPRGPLVFDYLVRTLDEYGDRARRRAAATALSHTNLSRAAAVLGKHFQKLSEVPSLMVSMGDLAVPELTSLAGQGVEGSVECLRSIGTPLAAQKLADLLWDDEPDQTSVRAACNLAALLQNPAVEEALEQYRLDDRQRSAPRLHYVWEPFDRALPSTLSVIVGRVAFILNRFAHWPSSFFPADVPQVDSRIGVPVCAINLWGERVKQPLQLKDATVGIIGVASRLEKMLSEEGGRAGVRAPASAGQSGPAVAGDLFHFASLMKALREIPTREWQPEDLNVLLDALRDRTNDSKFLEVQDDLIREVLSLVKTPPLFEYLMLRLPPGIQLKLLKSLASGPPPTQADWKNIFRPLTYTFREGWHYRTIMALLFGLSLAATAAMVELLISYWWGGAAGGWLPVTLAGVGLASLTWSLGVFLSGSSTMRFDRQDPDFLVLLLLGPLIPIIALVYLLNKGARGDLEPKGMYFALSTAPAFPALAYFASVALLKYMAWPYVVLAWVGIVAVVTLLAVLGFRREREAKNPLHGIIEAPAGDGALPRRGKIRSAFTRPDA